MSCSWSQLLPSRYFGMCSTRYGKEEGSFLHCKGQVGAYLCKSVSLVGIKECGLVMASPLGFHSKEYWLSGFGGFPFMWWKSPIMLGIYSLCWCPVLLEMIPL